jgi:HNH endonuclease
MGLLPPALGGARSQPLDVGRATRVVAPAQCTALTVRDGGCRSPCCDRPVAWCDAHHLRHWLQGGPTDLGNLLLLCRGHHHAVHEGGWRLHRNPDGTFTATPPHRRRPTAA